MIHRARVEHFKDRSFPWSHPDPSTGQPHLLHPVGVSPVVSKEHGSRIAGEDLVGEGVDLTTKGGGERCGGVRAE